MGFDFPGIGEFHGTRLETAREKHGIHAGSPDAAYSDYGQKNRVRECSGDVG